MYLGVSSLHCDEPPAPLLYRKETQMLLYGDGMLLLLGTQGGLKRYLAVLITVKGMVYGELAWHLQISTLKVLTAGGFLVSPV